MRTDPISVVRADGVIVSPRKRPVQVKFRWDPDLAEELRQIAERTDRSINEAGELLMRWAIERSKAELDLAAESESPLKRKKSQ